MSTISASTTTTTAFKIETDTTGALVFKTGASPTTAMTLGSDQSVTFAGTPTYSGGTANGVAYLNGSKVLTTGTALVFDGSNLGVGVTPSAWWASGKAYQVGSRTSLSDLSGDTHLTNNAYYDGTNWKYLTSNAAENYYQSGGSHAWRYAASGTAGATVSFATGMLLNSAGNLGVGVTPSTWGATFKAVQVGSTGSIYANSGNMILGNGVYNDGVTPKYLLSGSEVGAYLIGGSAHYWYSAGSGTAGNTIPWAQAMTLNSSGQLLLGTTSAIGAENFTIGNGSGSTFTATYLNAGSGGNALVGRISGSNTWFVGDTFAALGSGTGMMNYVYGANPWIVYTNGAERARFNSTGALVLAGGTTTANGTGITFPASVNLSSNANTLDDYEEGTWDARPSTSNTSVVPLAGWVLSNYSGYYVKVGSLVTLQFYFEWGNSTADTSIIYLILPFPATAGANMWSSTGCEVSNVTFPSGATYVTARPESGQSHMSFKGCGSTLSRVDMKFSNFGASSSGYCIGFASYRTSV